MGADTAAMGADTAAMETDTAAMGADTAAMGADTGTGAVDASQGVGAWVLVGVSAARFMQSLLGSDRESASRQMMAHDRTPSRDHGCRWSDQTRTQARGESARRRKIG
eukprot:1452966-Rhodomonas_salina.1